MRFFSGGRSGRKERREQDEKGREMQNCIDECAHRTEIFVMIYAPADDDDDDEEIEKRGENEKFIFSAVFPFHIRNS